jgi:hypothetical protein
VQLDPVLLLSPAISLTALQIEFPSHSGLPTSLLQPNHVVGGPAEGVVLHMPCA